MADHLPVRHILGLPGDGREQEEGERERQRSYQAPPPMQRGDSLLWTLCGLHPDFPPGSCLSYPWGQVLVTGAEMGQNG